MAATTITPINKSTEFSNGMTTKQNRKRLFRNGDGGIGQRFGAGSISCAPNGIEMTEEDGIITTAV